MREEINIRPVRNGFVPDVIAPEDYIFGSGQAPDPIIQEDGQWVDYLPAEESQRIQFDVYNCVSFATLNALEILIRKLGVSRNWSDRFLGIIAGTKPPGNSPHKVAEALRKNGAIEDSLLSFSPNLKNWQEYYSFLGGDEGKCRTEGEQFMRDYYFKHDYVTDTSPKSLMEALKRSPLGVSVFAWANKGELYVRPKGLEDTHWTALIGYKKGSYWLVYDSYEPFIKKLAWDFDFGLIKRYFIRPKTDEEKAQEAKMSRNALTEWLKRFISVLTPAWIYNYFLPLYKIAPVIEPEPEKETELTPRKSRIKDWAKIIEEFENTPKSWNNPGGIRALNGMFLKFKSYQDGFDYLCDYLIRAATGKHRAYLQGGETTLYKFTAIYAPKSDGNDPVKYSVFVSNKLGITIDTKIKELL